MRFTADFADNLTSFMFISFLLSSVSRLFICPCYRNEMQSESRDFVTEIAWRDRRRQKHQNQGHLAEDITPILQIQNLASTKAKCHPNTSSTILLN
jgi:hypothetical protein